jgi:hypothetical protein
MAQGAARPEAPELVPRSYQGSLVQGPLNEVRHHDHHRPLPQMLPAPRKIIGIVSPPKAFERRNDVVFCRFALAGKFHRVAHRIQPLDGTLVGWITIGVASAVDLDEFHDRHVDGSKTAIRRAVERCELLLEIDLVHVRLWSVIGALCPASVARMSEATSGFFTSSASAYRIRSCGLLAGRFSQLELDPRTVR